MRFYSRVSLGVRIVATVSLLAATACEKAKPAKDPALAIVPTGAPALNLAADPQILFQVFGDRDSPHMMPIAAVVNGAIKPIGLTLAGWKALDAKFMAPGTTYPFYAEGGNPGELTVQRDTAYSLPGCTSLKPMSVVQLTFKQPRSDPTVEFLASSGPIAPPRAAPAKMMSSADIVKIARAIGHEAGKRAHLSPAEMDSLDFNARMVQTGASNAPTLVISFIDPNAGEAKSGGWTGHLFALADSGANGYEATYVHVVKGNSKTVEFQRLVNHVDFNGDGADEIIVEAWRYAADNDLVVLGFKNGKWSEQTRVKQTWCLDAPKER
ncbi:MAG: hypothetical protein ACREN6_08925 [Gemmatimonadaceae bacterium]